MARKDTELGGKTIHAGDRMLLILAAANRDPAKYADPDRLDITRSPNPHVAFGQGIHVCLGAPLARLEAQEAFLALPHRFPELRLNIDPAQLEYQPTIVARALKALARLVVVGKRVPLCAYTSAEPADLIGHSFAHMPPFDQGGAPGVDL